MDFTDLQIERGADNMGGTTITAWAIPYSDIFRMPEFDPETNVMSDYATLYHNIIPKPYKTFYRIHASSDTGKIENTKVEGKEVNMNKSVYEFHYPKNDKNALGFMRLTGSKFVFIVQEADGNLRIMGSKKGMPAEIQTLSATSGIRSSGEKGSAFQVVSYQNGPAPIYRGLFNLDRDTRDLSLYPMLYTEKKVTEYNINGYPLTIDFYLDDLKIFTWTQEWNGNQLTRRSITVHVKN